MDKQLRETIISAVATADAKTLALVNEYLFQKYGYSYYQSYEAIRRVSGLSLQAWDNIMLAGEDVYH